MNMNTSGPNFDLSKPEKYEIELLNTRLSLNNNFSVINANETTTENRPIIVRPEEVFIVVFVLLLWMCAIGLFFHRWGKIRNCEPYAPKFEAELHRGSCHDQSNLLLNAHKRMSLSSKFAAPSMQLNPQYSGYNRSRQNSVFVSHFVAPSQPPRKTKSAMDLSIAE